MFKIIERMEDEGFQIEAITCDLGNTHVLKSLGFYKGNYFFEHPKDPERKIFIFPDVPHVLKLARSHMFDKGFLVPTEDGSQLVHLDVDDFWAILKKDDGEYKATKLTEFHINARNSARQRVRIAAQIFSSKVAQAFVFGDNSVEARAKCNAIQLFNDWFDVMNSGSKIDKNRLKCGLGVNKQAQFDVLDRMEKFVENMEVYYGNKNQNTSEAEKEQKDFSNDEMDEIDRLILDRLDQQSNDIRDEAESAPVPPPPPKVEKDKANIVIEESRKKPALLPWQKGILCSIRAVRGLYEKLVENGGFNFLLTKRLTQDCLENYFSKFRSLGGDSDHPGPVSSMRRIRILLIGKHSDIMVKNAAVEIEKPDPAIVEEEEEIVSKIVTNDIPLAEIHEIENLDMIPEVNDVQDGPHETIMQDIDIDTDIYHAWHLGSQAERYVAGYFAGKFSKLNLGTKTSECPTLEESDFEKNPWLKLIARKNLMDPTEEWWTDFRSFEAEFIEMHGNDADRGERVIDRFTAKLEEKFKDKYPKELYASFSKFRTCMRVKSLNKKNVRELLFQVVRHHRQMGQLQG